MPLQNQGYCAPTILASVTSQPPLNCLLPASICCKCMVSHFACVAAHAVATPTGADKTCAQPSQHHPPIHPFMRQAHVRIPLREAPQLLPCRCSISLMTCRLLTAHLVHPHARCAPTLGTCTHTQDQGLKPRVIVNPAPTTPRLPPASAALPALL